MDDQSLKHEGLNPKTIATHLRRIRRALEKDNAPHFPIEDTCRLDNGGIVRFNKMPESKDEASIAAFIPAAGAATRYSKPLIPLLTALQEKNKDEIAKAVENLVFLGAQHWPLSHAVKQVLANPADAQAWDQAATEIQNPKALQPCVIDEPISFLKMKDLEHAAYPLLSAQVFVAPYQQGETFAKHLGPNPAIKTIFLEQGPSLSTIRVKASGEPLEEDGKPSIVPAGHGALAELFPEVKRNLPGCEAILIRNIDNVTGSHSFAVNAVEHFLQGFNYVIGKVKSIRAALAEDNTTKAEAEAQKLANCFHLDRHGTWLATVMERLFHTPCSHEDTAGMLSLYQRPLNILGQVPNLSHDVGGTPCFVEHAGRSIKICLEVPHASESDKQQFLANPAKATHFNPVFVCAELTDDPDYYGDQGEDFWLLARKTHLGEPVLYHESVLYELLGNSETSNCIFVEIPRFLFHPRKSIADGKDAKLSSLQG